MTGITARLNGLSRGQLGVGSGWICPFCSRSPRCEAGGWLSGGGVVPKLGGRAAFGVPADAVALRIVASRPSTCPPLRWISDVNWVRSAPAIWRIPDPLGADRIVRRGCRDVGLPAWGLYCGRATTVTYCAKSTSVRYVAALASLLAGWNAIK